MINLVFDKLVLVSDSLYGTHVTYIKYSDNIFLDFYTMFESLDDIIDEIKYRIERGNIRK